MNHPLFFKLLFASIMLVTSCVAGIAPLYIQQFRQNPLLSSLGNCFSSGIFVAVALIHLLPQGVDDIEDSIGGAIPVGYIMVIVGYTIILFIQRIIFNHQQHSLFDMGKSYRSFSNPKLIPPQPTQYNPPEHSLQTNPERNLSAEKIQHLKKESSQNKKENPAKNRDIFITGIVLATALSVHSIFQGIVIGLESNSAQVINISLAIILHKIPASVALGNSLKFMKKKKAVTLVMIFTVASPIGILIGIGLESMNQPILVGVSLTVCSGTFLYIACSDLIIQEFGEEKYKKSKFVAFLVGIVMFAVLQQIITD